MEYYLQFDCKACGAEIFYGVCVTLLEHNGRPVVMADEGAQSTFHCDECGTDNVTGDLDVMVMGGASS